MKKFNEVTLNLTVSILDFLIKEETIKGFGFSKKLPALIFAFLSVLHLRESMGLRGPDHLYLMKEHFDQSVNETEHLEYMESRGGNAIISIVLLQHLVLIIIGLTWFIIGYLL